MFSFRATTTGSPDAVTVPDVDASVGSGSNVGIVLERDSSGRESVEALGAGVETATGALAAGAFASDGDAGAPTGVGAAAGAGEAAGVGTFLASIFGFV